MQSKAKLQAPIDRPLSRAYLRQFAGWSTAYAPGASDPTSLRLMENVFIDRNGAAGPRPGLRYVSFDSVDGVLQGMAEEMVGSHEPFYLNDGSKAYLLAVREDDGTVGFRVLAPIPLGYAVQALDDPGIEFDVPQGVEQLAFTAATTYVKYLQIDNKIFALSNAGETMRMFYVGAEKKAKRLASIERPDWSLNDKLIVVHPEAAWINAGIPLGVRTNMVKSPSMQGIEAWAAGTATAIERSNSLAERGEYSLRLESLPVQTNMVPNPLGDVAGAGGFTGWTAQQKASGLSASGDSLRVQWAAGNNNEKARALSDPMPVQAFEAYRCTFDYGGGGGEVDGLRVQYLFYSGSGALITTMDQNCTLSSPDRKTPSAVTAPPGATSMRVAVQVDIDTTTSGNFFFKNVLVYNTDETGTAFFDGDSGADYFWTGTPHASASVHHPPQQVQAWTDVPNVPEDDHIVSAYVRGTAVRNVTLTLAYYEDTYVGFPLAAGSDSGNDATGSWTRYDATEPAPADTTQARVLVIVPSVARGEYHYVDSVLLETGTTLNDYFDGATDDTSTLLYDWVGDANNSRSTETEYAGANTIPTAETRTADTLISSTKADNDYNFAFFYTFNNELGESAPSMLTTRRVQRPWAGWLWEQPNSAGEPGGTETNDPALSADQLVAYMPQPVFEAALAQGATKWNLYVLAWSDQDVVPVTGSLVESRELKPDSVHNEVGWIRVTPAMASGGYDSAIVPTLTTRYNYTAPSAAGQGLVAADRMILVNDPTAAAVIRWTSNLMGSYTDFSASKGGGYKTLTSGELMIPACVKLWQNPQSADTLTILCLGTDGYSTGYYMAPAQVASQSEATNIMGFEETTATPGTTSPYGCEVLNNALFHPIDEMLMKSTANNYNISHKSQTDLISDQWAQLQSKIRMVSSQHDNRLYYLVQNPEGETLEDGCWGNEVWVLDTAAKTPTWMRWLVQGQSLRKMEQGGRIVMSVTRPDGVFYFDEGYHLDDVVDPGTKDISTRAVPWMLETNTQGANRAHDAWCHLRQANVTFGDFDGSLVYGLYGTDLNGRLVRKEKVVHHDGSDVETGHYDIEEFLEVKRDLKEWFFYVRSHVVDDEVVPFSGRISVVQYRYTPSSVNTGYAQGSVETFQYGRDAEGIVSTTTDNGVPMPLMDNRQP